MTPSHNFWLACLVSCLATTQLSLLSGQRAAAEVVQRQIAMSAQQIPFGDTKIDVQREAFVKWDATNRTLNLQLIAQLGDLHAKIPLATSVSKVRQELCSDSAQQGSTLRIDDSEISVNDGRLNVSIRGKVSRWACLDNPVPNAEVVWNAVNVGTSFFTKLPTVSSHRNFPITTKLSETPFYSNIEVSMTWSGPGIDTRSRNTSSATPETNDELKQFIQALTYATNPIVLQSSTLSKIISLNMRVESAVFSSVGSQIRSEMSLTASVDRSEFDNFIAVLSKSS